MKLQAMRERPKGIRDASPTFAGGLHQYHLSPEFTLRGQTSRCLSHCKPGFPLLAGECVPHNGKYTDKNVERDLSLGIWSQEQVALQIHLLFHFILSRTPQEQRHDPVSAAVGSGAPPLFSKESTVLQLAEQVLRVRPPPRHRECAPDRFLHGPAPWRPGVSSGLLGVLGGTEAAIVSLAWRRPGTP